MRETKRNVTAVDTKSLFKRLSIQQLRSSSIFLPFSLFSEEKFPQFFFSVSCTNGQKQIHICYVLFSVPITLYDTLRKQRIPHSFTLVRFMIRLLATTRTRSACLLNLIYTQIYRIHIRIRTYIHIHIYTSVTHWRCAHL